MKIFIDTPAKWNSGYETHLKQFLSNYDDIKNDDKILIYGHSRLINKIRSLTGKVSFFVDDSIPGSSFRALIWRKKYIRKLISHYSPDVHLNLMGWINHQEKNVIKVSMNRNLQPFIKESYEEQPFFSKEFFRLTLYKKAIIKSYNNADGIIFNSKYAEEIVSPFLKKTIKTTVIPHGVNKKFFIAPRIQEKTDDISILYVSDFYPYKNQEVLIKSINLIRKTTKKNIKLNLIGEINPAAKKRIEKLLRCVPDYSIWIKFHQKVPYEVLKDHFLSNDIFVFLSSVESFGHTLIEAMAAGLPVICSNKRPMKDFIKEGALLVNEKNELDVSKKILEFIDNPCLREKKASIAFNEAKKFSYEKMTIQTLDFLHSL